MKIIGITGGVGSGKSRVLSYIKERFCACICQADHVAWELQEPGQRCYTKIVAHFGNDILNEDETINRTKLGQIVFRDNKQLSVLNEIMHPVVKETIVKRIQSERAKGTAYFVLEAALLLEDGYDQICDELWYIHTEEKIRRMRLSESRAYSDEKMDAIMASQLPEATFREKCQRTIDNSGDFEDTCYQINQAMKQE